MTCVCGKGDSTETHCGPLLRGEKKAETAEELMRARYAAYATGAVDFIVSSSDPETREQVDAKQTEAWSKQSEWLGLEVIGTERGGPEDDTGLVEFIARYKTRGVTVPHHEKAMFRKKDGEWFFVDGQAVAGQPVVKGKQTGRNDPCPCGSGKKYKKCCGKAA